MKRRNFFKWSIGGILTGSLIPQKVLALDPTPSDQEGPFYPVTPMASKDFDLTVVKGKQGVAKGEIIEIHGTVVDVDGKPLSSTIVEMWQADNNGLYHHPGHAQKNQLDPNFQYFCRVLTNNTGQFKIRTIMPGLYPGRPRHIHWKFAAYGKNVLTTQSYFVGQGGVTSLALNFNETTPEGYKLAKWQVVVA